MFETFIYNDINPGKIRKQFDRTIEQLSRADFASAEVKKMTGTSYYRAKLDYENRLLFRFARHNDETCLLILEVIFNHEYANRMGNGNEASKDGFKYAGKGFIQLTGKANYLEFDKSVPEDIMANPELVATKYPLASAAWFWNKNGLNEIADKGATDAVVKSITKRVNGGTIGLEDRIQHFNEFYSLLG